MSNVVCLIKVEAGKAEFTWTEGPASFEPYTLEGIGYKTFEEIAKEARKKLANLVDNHFHKDPQTAKSAYALASTGYELYQALFRPGAQGVDKANKVRKWLEELAEQDEVDTLEIVVDKVWSLPWNVVYDRPPDKTAFLSNDESSKRWKPFWGLRYNLAGGHKVDPLRRKPLLKDPKVLMVVDLAIRDGLPEDQQKRIADFVAKHSLKMVHEKEDLQDAIAGQRPDLLYWLSHANADALVLGDEEISPGHIYRMLMQENGSVFGGLAFLNACQTAETGAAGSFFQAFNEVGFAGMIGTEHQTVDQFANKLGLDFLEAFLEQGEPVGSILRQLRKQVPLGLLYGTYCPPDIRVDKGEKDQSIEIQQVQVQGIKLGLSQAVAPLEYSPLPDEPYRSLAYYDREDRALFAGREEDVERFATMLDGAATRILVLHGESGVGKSSFLRAGVIPFLEEECLGYRFLRDRLAGQEQEKQDSVIFVRATNDLFGQLAQALCEFCARPYEYQNPLGELVKADLPGVLREEIGEEVNQWTVRAVLRSDPGLLGKILSSMSARLPFAIILVIDQGEEVFTLAQTPEDLKRGHQSLDMLRRTVSTAGDFKIIFCLRTEYYGRVIDRLRRGLQDTGRIREYLLTDFDEDSLLEAIRRPTSADEIPYSAEIPFNQYGFRYADGVAEEISRRVVYYTTQRRDSVLPLMQVICSQLYRQAMERADHTITLANLETLGGIEGGMRSHVEGLLVDLVKGRPLDKRPVKTLFTQLYLKQPDGTLTTALLPEEEVENRWTGRMPFGELLGSCRDLRLLKVNSLRIGMEAERRYVSLGHDALAKIAAHWDEQLSRGARLRKMAIAIGAVSAVALFMCGMAIWAWRLKQDAVNLREKADLATGVAIENQEKARTAEVKAEEQSKLNRRRLYLAQMNLSGLSSEDDGAMHIIRKQLNDWVPLSDRTDLRGWEWRFLHAHTHQERQDIQTSLDGGYSLDWSPDGSLLAVGGIEKVLIWDTKSGRPEFLDGHKSHVRALKWDPAGKRLASGDMKGELIVWDDPIGEGVPHHFPDQNGPINAVNWNRDGTILAALVDDKDSGPRIAVWKPKVSSKPRYLERATGWQLQFNPKNDLLAGGSYNDVRIWDLTDFKTPRIKQALKGAKSTVTSVAWDPSGEQLAAGTEHGQIHLWNLTLDEPCRPLSGHTKLVKHLSWSPVEPWQLASSSFDYSVRVWDPEDGREFNNLRGHTDHVYSVEWSPDGTRIASVSHNGEVKLWDPKVSTIWKVGEEQPEPTRFTHSSIAWHPAKPFLATSIGEKSTRWSTDSWEQTGDITGSSLSLNFDGTLMAVYREDAIEILNTETGEIAKTASVPDGKDRRKFSGEILLWHPERNLVAIVGEYENAQFNPGDCALFFWDINSESAPVKTLEFSYSPLSAAWSRNGRQLAIGSLYGKISLWDNEEGRELPCDSPYRSHIWSICWNPEGDRIVLGLEDHSIRMIDLEMGEHATLLGHTFVVRGVAWHPLEQRLASASEDGTMRVWDTTTGDLATTLELQGSGRAVAWSRDGKELVALTSKGQLKVWNALAGYQFDDALAQVSEGRKRAIEGDVEGAIVAFQEARRLDPEIKLDLESKSPEEDLRAIAQKLAATAKVWKGCERALAGDVDGAIAIFREAQQMTPGIDLDPETEVIENDPQVVARYLAATARVGGGCDLARAGDVNGAIAAFREAQRLVPSIDLDQETDGIEQDPEALVKSLAPFSNIDWGIEFAKEGRLEEAIKEYDKAKAQNQELEKEAWFWNVVGRSRCLNGEATKALSDCKKAVKLAAKDAHLLWQSRETRCIARAITGDIKGAIDDLKAVIDSDELDEEDEDLREEWLQSLEEGDNPFTPEALGELRKPLLDQLGKGQAGEE